MLKYDQAGIVVVFYKNKIIGGGFFLYDKYTIYNWYRGALDYEYKKQYPSVIADWAIMKYGLENGLENFDFMGAGIKGQKYGVRTYKSRFGGELVEFGRFHIVTNKILYKLGFIALDISKKIIDLIGIDTFQKYAQR